ncbi:MAG: hypothetical protein MUF69_11420 [Desulfobacterota bacterium]|nr:hypothetical protein [Thermodesulfobacteriota bacterium]
MKTYLAFFATALLAAFLLTPWVRNRGIQWGIPFWDFYFTVTCSWNKSGYFGSP